MDRNGKKPKASHNEPPHPERSDTKVHDRVEAEDKGAKGRADAVEAAAEERLALKNARRKGPRHL